MRRALTLPRTTNAGVDIPRAAAATLGLGVAGAAAGAAVGALLFAVLVMAAEGYSRHTYLSVVLQAGAIVGGAVGALVIPFTAWTLPHVPLGRILCATTAATIVGTLMGALFTGVDTLGPMLGATVGFGSATSWLGFRSGGNTSFDAD
jgi:hypothetical protein